MDSDLLQVEFNNLTPSIPYDISVSAVVGDREGPPNVELVETSKYTRFSLFFSNTNLMGSPDWY